MPQHFCAAEFGFGDGGRQAIKSAFTDHAGIIAA
jgi:hypothetical protein